MKLGERYREYRHERQLDRERRVIGRDNLVRMAHLAAEGLDPTSAYTTIEVAEPTEAEVLEEYARYRTMGGTVIGEFEVALEKTARDEG